MNQKTETLGPCCGTGCTTTKTRNILCLHFEGPSPGKGWGCVVCHQPANGAVAVLCDSCLQKISSHNGEKGDLYGIDRICTGYPKEDGRTALKGYKQIPFAHIDLAHKLDGLEPEFTEEVGDSVVCDLCNEDWTDRPETGGFLFQSYAYCPTCAGKHLQSIADAGELRFIRGFCPPDVSFADWVRMIRYATGDTKITIFS